MVSKIRTGIWAAALGIAVFVTFNMMKAPEQTISPPKEDHIMAAVVGPDAKANSAGRQP